MRLMLIEALGLILMATSAMGILQDWMGIHYPEQQMFIFGTFISSLNVLIYGRIIKIEKTITKT